MFAIFVSLFFAPFAVKAQTGFSETVVLDLPNGTAISFQPETSLLKTTANGFTFSFSNLRQQAVKGQEKLVHRFLYDETNNVLFGYDLILETDPKSDQIKILVQPMAAADAQTLREQFFPASSNRRKVRLLTLPPSPNSQLLTSGDALTLDLLVSQQLNLKITDRLRFYVSNRDLPKVPVRDFTLDNIELAVKNAKLVVNGEDFAETAPSRRYSGSLLWFELPDKGMFVFSLTPREGYDFRKIGTVNDRKIKFLLDGTEYEWNSSEKILPIDGAWSLWVLRVPNYSPQTMSLAPPREEKRRPTWLLPFTFVRDLALRLIPFRSRPEVQAQPSQGFRPISTNPFFLNNFRRPRLRAGGTKQIESLIPKN